MAREVIVTNHALDRFKERGNPHATKEQIIGLFKNQPINMPEPAWRGRETVQCGAWVWVINRTRTKTAVTTCLGSANDYHIKRPDRMGDSAETAYAKWLSQQRRKVWGKIERY